MKDMRIRIDELTHHYDDAAKKLFGIDWGDLNLKYRFWEVFFS